MPDGGVVPADYDLDDSWAYEYGWTPESTVAVIDKITAIWATRKEFRYEDFVYIDTMSNEFGHMELRNAFGWKFRGNGLEPDSGADHNLLWKSDSPYDNWRWTPRIKPGSASADALAELPTIDCEERAG